MTKLINNIEFYTEVEMAPLTGYTHQGFICWRKRGKDFPFKFYKMGWRILYKKQEVDEYLEKTFGKREKK